jgi:hypothetical protein
VRKCYPAASSSRTRQRKATGTILCGFQGTDQLANWELNEWRSTRSRKVQNWQFVAPWRQLPSCFYTSIGARGLSSCIASERNWTSPQVYIPDPTTLLDELSILLDLAAAGEEETVGLPLIESWAIRVPVYPQTLPSTWERTKVDCRWQWMYAW